MPNLLKKTLLIFLALIMILGNTGCSSNSNLEENDNEIQEANVVRATLDSDGNIIIHEDEITETTNFIDYEIDGVTIGFLAVRASDGTVRVAFNTCQSCSPSPNAYFIQKGDYFECQNCKNKFHRDQIGIEKGGCNPAPVEEMTQENGIITISKDYVQTYKDNFKNWNGPMIKDNFSVDY